MIEVGDVYPLVCTVTRETGDPVDAGSMRLVVTMPDGTVLESPGDLEIAHTVGTGVYTCDLLMTQVGQWSYRWIATGTNAGEQADVINVDPAGPRLVSLEEARQHLSGLKKPCRTPAELEELRQLILVASRAIELDLQRVLTPRTITEDHPWGSPIFLRQGPARQIVSVAVNGTDAPAGAWLMRHDGILENRYGWANLSPWDTSQLTVTYRAGDPVVEPVVRHVCKAWIKRSWQQSRQIPRVPPDDYSTDDLAAAYSTLTPIEQAAYDSLRRTAIA